MKKGREVVVAEGKPSSVNWSLVCHVSGLALYIGIPLGNVFVPLAIWLLKRGKDASVDVEGREALNFNISFSIYALIAGLLCYVLVGFVLLPVVLITHVVLVIQATLKANQGKSVHYPLTLRFLTTTGQA